MRGLSELAGRISGGLPARRHGSVDPAKDSIHLNPSREFSQPHDAFFSSAHINEFVVLERSIRFQICFLLLVKGAILIGSGKTDLFHFSERFTTISASGYGNACFICVCFCS